MQNLLSYIFLFPLVVALVMMVLPGSTKVYRSMAIAAIGVQLVLSVLLLLGFDQQYMPSKWADAFQYVEKVDRN